MVNQGFWGAIEQYFCVEDKPRLHRRNTYFEDNFNIDEESAILGLFITIVILSTIIAWSMVFVGGMM